MIGHIRTKANLVLSRLEQCKSIQVLPLDIIKLFTEYTNPYIDHSTCLFRLKQASNGFLELQVHMFRTTKDQSFNMNPCESLDTEDWVRIPTVIHGGLHEQDPFCCHQHIFVYASYRSIVGYNLLTDRWTREIMFDRGCQTLADDDSIYFFKNDYETRSCTEFAVWSPATPGDVHDTTCGMFIRRHW